MARPARKWTASAYFGRAVYSSTHAVEQLRRRFSRVPRQDRRASRWLEERVRSGVVLDVRRPGRDAELEADVRFDWLGTRGRAVVAVSGPDLVIVTVIRE